VTNRRAIRVLMVGDFPANLDQPQGGVETVTRNLAFGLAEAGIDLTVVRFGNDRETFPTNDLPFDVIDLARRRPGSIGNWLISPGDVQRIVDDRSPDIVHLQGTTELYRGSRPPSVLTIHGIAYKDATHGSGFARRLLQPLLLRLSFEESIRNHQHVIAINKVVRKEVGERHHITYHDIANPVENEFFEITRTPIAGRLLYVGVLSPLKNIEGLIEAAALVRSMGVPLSLRLAGPFTENYEPAVRASIERLDMTEAVTVLGSLSRSQVREELGLCAALGLASFQETAPMVIAEAMAAGVPVIATLAGGIGNMLDHDRTGMTSPVGDVSAFANNLASILANDEKRDEIGRAARIAAEQTYRLSNVVARTCDVYKAAIDSANA